MLLHPKASNPLKGGRKKILPTLQIISRILLPCSQNRKRNESLLARTGAGSQQYIFCDAIQITAIRYEMRNFSEIASNSYGWSTLDPNRFVFSGLG
jgi:hypothetical protein